MVDRFLSPLHIPHVQTTLRMDDNLIRNAKAEASRQGVSLTRFIEESIRLRLLELKTPPRPSAPELLPSAELIPLPGIHLASSRDIWDQLTAADLADGKIPSL